jgi:hypothetical protein
MTKTRSCGVEGSERSILAQIPLPCPGPAKLETGCTPCGSWSEWSEVECSQTCGEGNMVVERECLTEEGNELEIIFKRKYEITLPAVDSSVGRAGDCRGLSSYL